MLEDQYFGIPTTPQHTTMHMYTLKKALWMAAGCGASGVSVGSVIWTQQRRFTMAHLFSQRKTDVDELSLAMILTFIRLLPNSRRKPGNLDVSNFVGHVRFPSQIVTIVYSFPQPCTFMYYQVDPTLSSQNCC